MTAALKFYSDANSFPLAPDTVLQDRYCIVKQLGSGGMGAVYEAVDKRLGITVALKETFSSELCMRKQFEHEARLLASMQHPALPRVSDHFVEGNRAFLVMQFIGGVDLSRIIAQQPGPFPRDQVIAWADQLLDALIYLHSRDRQVIHRDIKPHNLKLTATGQIALLDFGLAKAQPSDPSVTSSQAFFGYTRHYAPLEQIQDQRTDPRSDIYALGATLYHLLTGIKPPDAMVRASALVNSQPDPLKPANKIHAAVGPQIAAILNKAMAQKSEERYASASEFREALRRVGRAKQPEVDAAERSARGTIHVSDLSSAPATETAGLNMALVVSAKRFGAGSMTAVLVSVLALAGGILYGTQRWLKSPDKVIVASPANSSTTTQRQPGAARKVERSRSTDNVNATAVKARNPNEANPRQRTSNKGQVVQVAKSQAASGRRQEPRGAESRQGRLRIEAPAIRLPSPELRSKALAPFSATRMSVYGSSGAAPKFFRAADGTQIVKFSDGSTRVVRPGERSAQ